MASKKIAGIVLEIGGDTKPLNKALGEVNKTSRDLQGELKQVERHLKLEPTNVTLLKQKQDLLTESVKNTGDKLSALKDAQKQVNEQFAKGDISAEQYRAFQREVIKTEEELKNLEAQLGQVNDKWKDTADKIGEFGNKSTELGQKFAPVSAAAGAVAGGMVAMAVKAGQAVDELNTLSQTTGLSIETLQKFQFASDLIDVSMETLTGSLTKLTRNMASAKDGNKNLEEAFKTLGVRITDNSGKLRDNEDVFNDAIKALGNVANETERDALAMQLFGKSAQDLNPLILGGADALKEMGDKAKEAGLLLSEDATKSLGDFNDEIDELKATGSATMLQLGAKIAETLLPVVESLSEKMKGVMEWVRNLDKRTLAMILTIAGIVAAVSPVLLILGSMAGAISNLISLGKTLGTAITFLTGPMGLAILAIGALITAGVLLYKNWDKIKEHAQKLWEGIKYNFNLIKTFIMGVWNYVVDGAKDKINKMIGFINSMIESLNKLKVKMPDFMGGREIGFNIKTIPMLGEGGRAIRDGLALVGERGPEIVKLTQGAEVVPLDKAGIGNVNVYVQADSLQQMADVVRLFERLPQAARQGV